MLAYVHGSLAALRTCERRDAAGAVCSLGGDESGAVLGALLSNFNSLLKAQREDGFRVGLNFSLI